MTGGPVGLAELAVVERSGFVESRHMGSVVAVRADGSTGIALGDAAATVLPRSSLKPWQALACRVAGLHLPPHLTAVTAGSHTGEDAHVEAVREILALQGLDERDLQCPPDWPEDTATRHRLVAQGEGPNRFRMNCSGKHAAMLVASARNGWDLDSYLHHDHPVQRQVRETVEAATGCAVRHVAVDGCGAPVLGIPLHALAHAVRRLVLAAEGSDERTVADAMRSHPQLVGGTGHRNTELMRRVPGVLAKGGAEGVFVAAAASGQAVAVKVADGSPRATTLVALAALAVAGADVSGAGDLAAVPVLGGGRPVGAVRLGADLARAALSVSAPPDRVADGSP